MTQQTPQYVTRTQADVMTSQRHRSTSSASVRRPSVASSERSLDVTRDHHHHDDSTDLSPLVTPADDDVIASRAVMATPENDDLSDTSASELDVVIVQPSKADSVPNMDERIDDVMDDDVIASDQLQPVECDVIQAQRVELVESAGRDVTTFSGVVDTGSVSEALGAGRYTHLSHAPVTRTCSCNLRLLQDQQPVI